MKQAYDESYDTFSQIRKSYNVNNTITPFRSNNRFYVLFLCSFLMFGGYFWMDQPNALSKYINDDLTNHSSIKYNLLYSFYSYPNIILPFFSGVFIDKLGLKLSMYILFFLCISGQAFFTVGGFSQGTFGYSLALIGRTLLGKFWIYKF